MCCRQLGLFLCYAPLIMDSEHLTRQCRLRGASAIQGFGRRLMFGVEVLAVERGFSKVSASVDSSEGRLLQHYLRLGGIVQQNSASLLVAVSC